jgi:hypothetical protein
MRSKITPAASFNAVDRWSSWLALTFGVHVSAFVFFSASICGCHFHLIAVPFSLIPLVWTVFTLATYRTAGERFVGFGNLLFALVWCFIAWEGNIRFLF